MTTWILVSDSVQARLFAVDRPGLPWQRIHAFEHPEGRKASREIQPSDARGKMQQGTTAGGHHTAFEPRTDARTASNQRFADEMAEYIEHGCAGHAFEDLVLVAEPHWLGVMSKALGAQSAKRVRALVRKDLAKLEDAELPERLATDVFPQMARP